MSRAAATVALFAALLCGCGDGDARAWLGEVRGLSDEAAAAEASDDRGAALDALTRIVEREVPAAVAADDARVVRQDAYERLARLRLEAGDPEAARAAAERGLALGEREDLFTANLLVQRGRAREASGDDAGAARDYHRALLIHEALLDAALGGDGED